MALCEEMKANCDQLPKTGMDHSGLVANKYDAIIASMSITDERKQTIDFTNVLFKLSGCHWTKGQVRSQDMAGKLLGHSVQLASQWAEDNLGASRCQVV